MLQHARVRSLLKYTFQMCKEQLKKPSPKSKNTKASDKSESKSNLSIFCA